MKVPFVICDVFTDTRFGGNKLAVVTDARDLSDADMQRIAREFGFSETTFVLPADASTDDGATHRVRIFTPVSELPVAGHPNVGTAFALASHAGGESLDAFRFREGAGIVEITVARAAGGIGCELRVSEPFVIGANVDPGLVARACGLAETDGDLRWTARQGDDMGRPSRLDVRATKRDGRVTDVFVGGRSVLVAEGVLHLGGAT